MTSTHKASKIPSVTLALGLAGTHRSSRPWKSCSTCSSLCLSGAGRPSPSSASLLGAFRSEFTCNRWGPVLVASGWRKEEGWRVSRYLRPLFKDLPYARLTLGAEEQERG